MFDFYELPSLTDSDCSFTDDKKTFVAQNEGRRLKRADAEKRKYHSSLCEVHHSVNVTEDFDGLEKQVVQEIFSKHSQIQTPPPFRTDIKGALNGNTIYSKQFPYPYSVNNFANQEVNRMLHENIIRPIKNPYTLVGLVWSRGQKYF